MFNKDQLLFVSEASAVQNSLNQFSDFHFNFFYAFKKNWRVGGGNSIIIQFSICKFKKNISCEKKCPPSDQSAL